MNNKKGFTLIELLVVIAIIGLLSTLAVVALNSARAKSRDARRLSDVKQIQTALEMYLNDNSRYPTTPTTAGPGVCANIGTLVSASVTGLCISANSATIGTCNGTTYMATLPADPLDSPTGTRVPYCYTSTGDATYSMRYTLENATAGYAAGSHIATPAGMAN